jgi:hypothetical protein
VLASGSAQGIMPMTSGYDVIGDVHGQADKLEALLRRLGYRQVDGSWRHPDRTAIFVGDFIDRGPHQVRTCLLVKNMVESGSARAVMGNHEFNAIGFHTPDETGKPHRPHSDKNRAQHAAFLTGIEGQPELREELLNWFWELPLWLDLDGIRVVHACWHDALMAALAPRLRSGNRLDPLTLRAASTGGNGSYRADGSARETALEFRAIETVLKGLEVDLPGGASFTDKDGHERHSVRVEWWREGQPTYREAALLPSKDRAALPAEPVPASVLPGYGHEKPVFIGHYWMTGTPAVLSGKVACVDYSAGRDGPLVAYRWSGERDLDSRQFAAAG